MRLRFIADIHISPLTVSELKENEYDIIRVTDKLPATASDNEIIQLAYKEQAVIITQDLDFSAIIAQSGFNGRVLFLCVLIMPNRIKSQDF